MQKFVLDFPVNLLFLCNRLITRRKLSNSVLVPLNEEMTSSTYLDQNQIYFEEIRRFFFQSCLFIYKYVSFANESEFTRFTHNF